MDVSKPNLDSVREQLDTFKLKMEQDNGFVTDKCDVDFIEIIDTPKEADAYFDRFYHFFKPFMSNPTMFTNRKKIFEILDLGKKNKKKKGESPLYCYKHTKNGKNNKNIRCIFIIEDRKAYFLLAFIENNKSDYSSPIDTAIERYNDIYEGDI